MEPFQWTCGFCNSNQIATHNNAESNFDYQEIGKSKQGLFGVESLTIRCLNSDCNESTIHVGIRPAKYIQGRGWGGDGRALQTWTLRPETSAKSQPPYIPSVLVEDYTEACRIRDLSPKASATLSRRCLQGMIRDFASISKARLIDEINTLKDAVNAGSAPQGVAPETIDAIDAVRSIGNIGAHMEKDISLIVEVDPGEAQALIDLLELLFDEWYVARHDRQERLAKVQAIAAQKKADLVAQKATALPPAGTP